MERIHQLQQAAAVKTQEWQKSLGAKGYGSLYTGAAAAIMLFVFCPMSIVAIATPYWTHSEEVQGNAVSAKASLWEVSVSVEVQGMSSESEISMCSDEMSSFDDCGKIEAIRFFVISALFLCIGSAVLFILNFSPVLKPTAGLRRKMSLAGVSLAAAVLLWKFLAVCIASSVDMPDNYKLNGVGFVFLVIELFFVTLAIVLEGCAIKRGASSTTIVEVGVADATKSKEQDASGSSPNLPTILDQGSQSGQHIKVHSENPSNSKDANLVSPVTNEAEQAS